MKGSAVIVALSPKQGSNTKTKAGVDVGLYCKHSCVDLERRREFGEVVRFHLHIFLMKM